MAAAAAAAGWERWQERWWACPRRAQERGSLRHWLTLALHPSPSLPPCVPPPTQQNLGLYAERVGAISWVLSDAGAAARTLSQMKRIARAIYSNPPVHGARIVSEVLRAGRLYWHCIAWALGTGLDARC